MPYFLLTTVLLFIHLLTSSLLKNSRSSLKYTLGNNAVFVVMVLTQTQLMQYDEV